MARLELGPPLGAAPMDRLDAQGSSFSRDPLPRAPRVLWRAQIPGGITGSIAVDRAGSVALTTQDGRLMQLDDAGKPAWSLNLESVCPHGPFLLGGARRGAITEQAELVVADSQGHLLVRRELDAATQPPSAAPLPLPDGTLAAAFGSRLVVVEATGMPRHAVTVSGTVVALRLHGAALWALTRKGTLYEWAPGRTALLLSEATEAPVDGPIALCGEFLYAVDTQKRVLRWQPGARGGAPGELVPGVGSADALACGSADQVLVLRADGLLLSLDGTGIKTLSTLPAAAAAARISPAPSRSPPTGAARRLARASSAELFVDAAGTLVIARSASLSALAVGAAATDVEVPACGGVVVTAPSGSHRLTVGCPTGALWRLEDPPASGHVKRARAPSAPGGSAPQTPSPPRASASRRSAPSTPAPSRSAPPGPAPSTPAPSTPAPSTPAQPRPTSP